MNSNHKKTEAISKKKNPESIKGRTKPDSTENEATDLLTKISVDFSAQQIEAQKKAQTEYIEASDNYTKTLKSLTPNTKEALSIVIAQQEYVDSLTDAYSDSEQARKLTNAYEHYFKTLYNLKTKQYDEDDNSSYYYYEPETLCAEDTAEKSAELQSATDSFNHCLEDYQNHLQTALKAAFNRYLLALLDHSNRNDSLKKLVTAQRDYSDLNMKITNDMVSEINTAYANAVDKTLDVQKNLQHQVSANAG